MHDFRDRHGLADMTTLVDDDGSAWSALGVRVQPAWLFVSPDGELDRVLGELSAEQIDRRLAVLAAAAGGDGDGTDGAAGGAGGDG
ncbi:hypothetical protein GCM10011354_18530 [Egicoccus halophilus]|uniref:Thioredoxin n=1 Tax=Egicoccus halophilus TaxID=1670830 RepID=A0A8J3A890_9ACTN|nr:hypothetical protein [Egicoccus halophilus]GGI06326.1 hypothetical protein GCM10011354_18530 [Egicoccus halophilus]